MGALLSSRGDDRAAVPRYLRALDVEPDRPGTHLLLGEAFQRLDRADLAFAHFERAVVLEPTLARARLGRAFALIRMGRYRQASEKLTEDIRAFPDQPAFAHVIARLMAAAPDDGVRDGDRAILLAEELARRDPSANVGETLAMAYAEGGSFERAAQVQRSVIDVARQAGAEDAVRRMTANLERYEAGRPCREPWADDDPVFRPDPPRDGRGPGRP